MSYKIIQPPFTLKFREMPVKELRAYAEWFHQVSPERISELTKAVKGTTGYQHWEPTFTPESLDVLGKWLECQIKTRRKTKEEIEKIRKDLTFPIDISNEELTNESFSLAMDIGMYFAEVIIKNIPNIRWEQILNNKRNADYGPPILSGFGKVPLNPVSIMVTKAYGISRKKPAELRKLYETWAKMRN